MEARLARIETHAEHLIADVADLRVSFARLDAKVDRLDSKMDAGFARQDAKIDRHFLILGAMIVPRSRRSPD